jgi:hypothetical protein
MRTIHIVKDKQRFYTWQLVDAANWVVASGNFSSVDKDSLVDYVKQLQHDFFHAPILDGTRVVVPSDEPWAYGED